MRGSLRGKLQPPDLHTSPEPCNTSLLEDLVAMGDGGAFMDTVIAPLFVVISYEVGECVVDMCYAWLGLLGPVLSVPAQHRATETLSVTLSCS